MLDTLTKIALIVPAIVAGLITILAAIAPITKSDIDNKAVDALRWFEEKVLNLLFPGLKNEDHVKDSTVE